MTCRSKFGDRMQIEVNEQNIVLYGLVQLTGNSTETLLMHAEQARQNGYVLTCRIPDIEQDLIDMNVFEAVDSKPSEEDDGRENPIMGG